SGIMNLSQTVSVIIGANVGTTITAWILSLTGIQENAAFLLRLLKPETFTPVLAFIGVCMILSAKSNRRKSVGSVLVGFAILMYGMILMASAMAPLGDIPQFREAMIAFHNPLLGFIVGLLVTVIVQSSSVSIGILQALTLVGGVSWGVAIPIILGQNLGACVAPMLASIGVNTNAKRVSGVYVIYNILSVGVCFPLFIILNLIFKFNFIPTDITPAGVALFHTAYNILTAVMLFPCAKLLERLAVKFIPDKNQPEEDKTVFLDERLLLAPSFAIAECFRKTIEMAAVVEFNFFYAAKMLKSFHQKKAEQIEANEIKIDTYEDKIDSFLLRLAGKDLTEEDSNRISQLLLTIGEYERIGDHACNILKVAKKLKDMDRKLSDEAMDELDIIINAVSEIYTLSFVAYRKDDAALSQQAEPLEAVIKKCIRRAKNNHIQRLKEGQCSAEISFLFSDLLNDFRRIAAHCGNIATSVMQLQDATIDKHVYSHRNKEEDAEFNSRYKDYKSRYRVVKKEETSAI
ncbi:Na/Pi cotransporter family protein, partial [bacterium]|nr:Na/Pi cotransporter family protein [bacterium]